MLMRVLLCKIHCPSFICFCKPPSHIYTAAPFKLENGPHAPSTTIVSVGDDAHCDGNDDVDHVACDGDESTEVKEGCGLGAKEGEHRQGGRYPLKSCLRKTVSGSGEVQKKKVQWVDVVGKELTEIREFEPSEFENLGYDGGRGCVCVIL